MREPDFFLVGAPKCGTTAMDEYLKQHPELFLPDRKEPQFFGTDLTSPAFIRDQEEYLRLFERARTEKRVGETSVWSLYSRRAAAEISAFRPDASIIVMLRNPVDMIPSLHSQYLYTGNEDIENLRDALEAEEDRRNGLRLPSTATFAQGLLYRETARYARQVARYFEVFGRENVHVIVFDDLKENPAEVYAETLRFLGVDPRFRPEFRVINPNKQVRNKSIQRLSQRPREGTRRVVRVLIPAPLRHSLMHVLNRYNTRYVPSRPVDSEVKERLRLEFLSEVERLEALIGRDLSGWSRETSA